MTSLTDSNDGKGPDASDVALFGTQLNLTPAVIIMMAKSRKTGQQVTAVFKRPKSYWEARQAAKRVFEITDDAFVRMTLKCRPKYSPKDTPWMLIDSLAWEDLLDCMEISVAHAYSEFQRLPFQLRLCISCTNNACCLSLRMNHTRQWWLITGTSREGMLPQ
ncbi:hypothetical protein B0H34DRAFT_702449 [Crassisporium funariophilum]|nr:hypothetical protein B0H34DRAFT_702449 [Crassisporium funariophilum]